MAPSFTQLLTRPQEDLLRAALPLPEALLPEAQPLPQVELLPQVPLLLQVVPLPQQEPPLSVLVPPHGRHQMAGSQIVTRN